MKMGEEIIQSRQNRTVVEVGKLTERRAREAARCFRFDGVKLMEEALKSGVELTHVLLRESSAGAIQADMTARYRAAWNASSARLLILSDGVFDKISEEKSPEGVICVAKYIDKLQKIVTIYNSGHFSEKENESVLLLESVRDPSNVGAIVRSAAALGVDRLILSEDCADIYHPKTVRGSMGTLFRQRIDRVGDLKAAIGALRAEGHRVFAAALDRDAYRLGDFPTQKGDCAVIGNEGHGLTEEVIHACDRSVYIPMREGVESLNAAVAASLLMWELFR